MATADMDESTVMCREKAEAIAERIKACYEQGFKFDAERDDDDDDVMDIVAYLDDAYSYLETMNVSADIKHIDEPDKFELMLGCGGPNIWLVLDGDRVRIEVYWGFSEYIMTLCSMTSDSGMFREIEDWFVAVWKDALAVHIAENTRRGY